MLVKEGATIGTKPVGIVTPLTITLSFAVGAAGKYVFKMPRLVLERPGIALSAANPAENWFCSMENSETASLGIFVLCPVRSLRSLVTPSTLKLLLRGR